MLNKIQKEQLIKDLLQLGFSDKESMVYLSILQSAEASVLTVAKDTNLSRGTIYDIVENLKSKGFVAEIKKGKKRRFVAESPTNSFYSILDRKHEKLEKAKKVVERILPLIKTVDIHSDFKPQIKVYSGEKGFRQVWDEIFNNPEKSFLSIARIETFLSFVGEDFLEEIMKRKVQLGFVSRAINENSSAALMMHERDVKEKRETRLAPKEFHFSSTEIIFGDKIAMFSTREENTIIVLESRDFAETHRTYFEMLWNFSEDQK